MDTCFGFGSESEDIKTLENLSGLTRKGGILIMETEDRDWRLANFENITNYRSKKIEIREKWNFNYETSVSESSSKFYEIHGNMRYLALQLTTRLRLYSLHELLRMLKDSNWRYMESYNDICTLKRFNGTKLNIVTISQKQ